MSNCFSFHTNDNSDRHSIAVFSRASPVKDEIVQIVKLDLSRVFLPQCVYLIVMEEFSNDLRGLINDIGFRAEIENLLRNNGYDNLIGLKVSRTGKFSNICENFSQDSISYSKLLKDGMLEIFRERKGLISSSTGYHFSKPSGYHCDKFIRASNLLVSSVEVTFLAISFLPYIKRGLKRIYVDTSSIAYLVLTALRLSSEVKDIDVTIDSFESYNAVNKSFDFVEDGASLIIISATTSGSLGRKILGNHSFSKNQIITFLHSNPLGSQIGLLDISSAIPDSISSNSQMECNFCKSGSRVIRISGDQFLPETPQTELIVINKKDFSIARKDLFKDYATKDILKWNILVSPNEEHREHFYIDFEKILRDNENKELSLNINLRKFSNRYLSREVKSIIAIDNRSSKELAESLATSYEDINIIQYSDLDCINISELESILVVASVITSGRKILAVSRKLRGIKSDAAITYLIGICKFETKNSCDQLRKNLSMGGREVVVLSNFLMPRIKDDQIQTSWAAEKEILDKYRTDSMIETDCELTPVLSERLKALLIGNMGSNDLFLKSPKNERLKLRNEFVFWVNLSLEDKIGRSTQSDVYWTIQAIMHDLRTLNRNEELATIYHTRLISPICFDRFNDGIIQACILRSALPVELDYSFDSDCSIQMRDIICSVLKDWDVDQGEAALEFLLSLSCLRLSLQKKHYEDVLACKKESMPQEMHFFFNHIEHEIM